MAITTPSDSPPAGASTRLLTMWAALAAVLLISLIGVTLAYVHGSVALSHSQDATRQARAAAAQARAAATQAQGTANCVNAILGARGPLNDADHANERQKINDQIKAEVDKARGLTVLSTAKNPTVARAGFEVYRRGVAEFVKSLDDWKARDLVIAKKKAAHPVGKC